MAYYTKGFEQIERIFKTSKLYCDKSEWEDYKYSTVTKALKMCNENDSTNRNLEYISAKELPNYKKYLSFGVILFVIIL